MQLSVASLSLLLDESSFVRRPLLALPSGQAVVASSAHAKIRSGHNFEQAEFSVTSNVPSRVGELLTTSGISSSNCTIAALATLPAPTDVERNSSYRSEKHSSSESAKSCLSSRCRSPKPSSRRTTLSSSYGLHVSRRSSNFVHGDMGACLHEQYATASAFEQAQRS